MKLADKIRYLREVEGSLRGLGRAMTQQELLRAIADETSGKGLSQSYLSQLESGARPHLTNTTRLLLAKFFKVHPGYLVEDPEDFQAELRTAEIMEDKLDLWLVSGAEQFGRRDPELCRALLAVSQHSDSRRCLLLLEAVLKTPALVDRLGSALGLEGTTAPEEKAPRPTKKDSKKDRKKSSKKDSKKEDKK
jgi:transcriptional regulator with XRE-family HTH domain